MKLSLNVMRRPRSIDWPQEVQKHRSTWTVSQQKVCAGASVRAPCLAARCLAATHGVRSSKPKPARKQTDHVV